MRSALWSCGQQRRWSLHTIPTVIMLQPVFAYSLEELLPELSNGLVRAARQTELQFYLVVALSFVTVLFSSQ